MTTRSACLRGCNFSRMAAQCCKLSTRVNRIYLVLFLIFINDLDFKLISSILKFADDTKLFGIVNTDVDREIIQQDLSQLVDWSDKWLMPFNISKCVVLHLGKSNREYDYDMGDTKLKSVKHEKDLGVLITRDLKPARLPGSIRKSKQSSWTHCSYNNLQVTKSHAAVI